MSCTKHHILYELSLILIAALICQSQLRLLVISYFTCSIDLPESAEELLRNTESLDLNVAFTRLEMIVSKYNTIMKSVSIFEQPLFERKLAQIDKVCSHDMTLHY